MGSFIVSGLLVQRVGVHFASDDLRYYMIPGTVLTPVVTHWVNGSRGNLGTAVLVSAGTMVVGLAGPGLIGVTVPIVQAVTSTWIERHTGRAPR